MSKDLLDTQERRRFIMREARAGASVRTIAERAVDEFGADRLPKRWDWRYVCKDIRRTMESVQEGIAELAGEYRTLQITRLEALLDRLMPMTHARTVETLTRKGEKVTVEREPDMKAVDRVLAILKRLDYYYNVDEGDLPEPQRDDGDRPNVFMQINQRVEAAHEHTPPPGQAGQIIEPAGELMESIPDTKGQADAD